MATKFVVIFEGETWDADVLTEAISKTAKTGEILWWHWARDAWLVVDKLDRKSTYWYDFIAAAVKESRTVGRHNVLILRVEPTGFSGSMPGKDWAKWIEAFWLSDTAKPSASSPPPPPS